MFREFVSGFATEVKTAPWTALAVTAVFASIIAVLAFGNTLQAASF